MSKVRTSLIEMCDFLGGTQPPKDEWLSSEAPGYIRMLQIRDFTQSEKNNVEYVKDTMNLKKCCSEDILIGRYGASVGKILTGLEGAYNVAMVKVIQKNNLLLRGYLFYYFNSTYFQNYILSVGSRAAQAGFNKEDLKNALIPVPSLDEQQKIVERLDKVSNLIALRKQQLAKLDEIVKARFVELFGEVGTDTKGWGLKRLGDCCAINPKKGEDKRLHQDLMVSFVPMPAVSEKGEINASEMKSYNDVKTGFTYFAEQDVLFAKITPCMENGKGAVARGLCNGIGFGSTEFHVLRPVEGVSNPYWLYTVTAFKQFRIDAASNMTGSAGQRRVPASFLEAYKVSLPPIELQNQFSTFVEQVDKSKLAIQKSLEQLETLKKSLMQEYFG